LLRETRVHEGEGPPSTKAVLNREIEKGRSADRTNKQRESSQEIKKNNARKKRKGVKRQRVTHEKGFLRAGLEPSTKLRSKRQIPLQTFPGGKVASRSTEKKKAEETELLG